MRRASSAGGSTAEARPASATTPRHAPDRGAVAVLRQHRAAALDQPPAADQAVAAHAAQHHADAAAAIDVGRPRRASDRPRAGSRSARACGRAGPGPRRRCRSTQRWASPGATWMRSSSDRSVAVARRRGPCGPRRLASWRAKWGMNIAGKMLGDEDRRADLPRQRAGGTRTRRGGRRSRRRARRSRAARRPCRAAGSAARRGRGAAHAGSRSARPMRRSRSASTSAKRPAKLPMPGLGRVSAAPSASARTVVSAPSSAIEETISTRAPLPGADDLGQRLEAARAGHLDVEQDDVDAGRSCSASSASPALPAVATISKSSMAGDHPRQHRPRHRRIVDDHQTRSGGSAGWSRPPPRKCRLAGSRDADDLQLGLERVAVERLHHIFVGAGVDRGADMGDVVLGGAEDDLGLERRNRPGEARAGTPSRSSPACSSRAG